MEDDVIENDSIFFFDTQYSDLEPDSLLDSLFGPNVWTLHLLSLVSGLFSSLVSLLLRTLLQLLVLVGAKWIFSWMIVHINKKHGYSSEFIYPQVPFLTQDDLSLFVKSSFVSRIIMISHGMESMKKLSISSQLLRSLSLQLSDNIECISCILQDPQFIIPYQ